MTAVITAALLVVVYFAWLRPYLKSLPSMAEIYGEEATYWATVKAWVNGRRTVLIGLWGTITAQLPDFMQQASGLDLKTLFGLPDHWAAYVTAAIPLLMIIFRTKSTS